jgi:hypothetical protein
MPDFVLCQFSHQLDAAEGFNGPYQAGNHVFTDGVPFQQPEEIKMPEFRKQVFPVTLVAVKVVYQRVAGFGTFIYVKKVFSLFFGKLDFYLVIHPEIKSEVVVELPAELVAFHGSHDTEQPGIFKKIAGQFIIVEPEFHRFPLSRRKGSIF